MLRCSMPGASLSTFPGHSWHALVLSASLIQSAHHLGRTHTMFHVLSLNLCVCVCQQTYSVYLSPSPTSISTATDNCGSPLKK